MSSQYNVCVLRTVEQQPMAASSLAMLGSLLYGSCLSGMICSIIGSNLQEDDEGYDYPVPNDSNRVTKTFNRKSLVFAVLGVLDRLLLKLCYMRPVFYI